MAYFELIKPRYSLFLLTHSKGSQLSLYVLPCGEAHTERNWGNGPHPSQQSARNWGPQSNSPKGNKYSQQLFKWIEVDPSLIEPSDKLQPWTLWVQPPGRPGLEDQLSYAWFMTHRNFDIINVCCFKSLNLWQFLMQQWILSIDV